MAEAKIPIKCVYLRIEGLWARTLSEFFILHWGLSYAGDAKSKAIYQLNRFPRERQLLIFRALIDRNKHQEMIVYRFFSLDNQL